MISGLLEVFWPSKCVACDAVLPADVALCERCDLTVEPLTPLGCRTCAEPGQFEFGVCLRCLARPSPLRRAIAAFVHEGAIARAIHRFKYEDHPELARSLVSLWRRELDHRLPRSYGVVVPLPLHVTRFRERRFDQAFLLARRLAFETGRRFVAALTRRRPTRRQVGLTERERHANVAGAFVADASVLDQRVLLVDDVLTTGATARAAAVALLDAGARDVQLVTLAKAHTL